MLQAIDESHQGGLAGSGVADDCRDRCATDVQADVLKSLNSARTGLEDLRHVVKSDVYVVCGSHGFFSNWGESGGQFLLVVARTRQGGWADVVTAPMVDRCR